MKNLKRLSLSFLLNLDPECIVKLGTLSQLEHLSLAWVVRLFDEEYAPLSGLSNLQSLDVRGAPFGRKGLESIAKLEHLKTLDLSRTRVEISDLAILAGSRSSLKKLNLGSLSLRGEDPRSSIRRLAELFPNLNTLTLRKLDAIDEDLTALQGLKHLEELDISDCKQVTGKGLKQLLQCPKLRKVVADGCPRLSEQMLEKFYKRP